MLSDKGLATEEDYKRFEAVQEYRKHHTTCVGFRICENCKHVISDSICLCIGIFTCPNCNFENGSKIKSMMETARENNIRGFRADSLIIDDYVVFKN